MGSGCDMSELKSFGPKTPTSSEIRQFNILIIAPFIKHISGFKINNLLTHFPNITIGLLRRKKESYKNLPVFDNFCATVTASLVSLTL